MNVALDISPAKISVKFLSATLWFTACFQAVFFATHYEYHFR